MACVAASTRRLYLALSPTEFDLRTLLVEIRGEESESRLARIRTAIAHDSAADWEHAILDAIASGRRTKAHPNVRIDLINEQIDELDFRLQRWADVPRVCARIVGNGGVVVALFMLCDGLSAADVSMDCAVIHAFNAVAVGIAGAVYCMAVHGRANSAAKERFVIVDQIVARLETLETLQGDAIGDPRSNGGRVAS